MTKELDVLPATAITHLAARVAARSNDDWRTGQHIANHHPNEASTACEMARFHKDLWEQLSRALSNNDTGELVRIIDGQGRAFARKNVPLKSVVEASAACLQRFTQMVLEEADHDPVFETNCKALPQLIRTVNHLQSRLTIALVGSYNDQQESGEVWLFNRAEGLKTRAQEQADANVLFRQLSSITGEYTVNRYRAFSPVFAESTDVPRTRFYFIREGTVQIQEYLPDGRALTLTILGRGDVFARFARTPGGGYFRDFQAETMRDTEIVWIEEAALTRAMEKSPMVAAGIIKSFSTQLATVQQLIQGLLGRDVAVRLTHLLLKLADEFGVVEADGSVRIDYSLSHQQLADMMGSNRVTVTRQLSELQKHGVLEIKRRSITLYNRQALEGIAS